LIERAVRDCGGKIASADGIGNGDDAASALLRQILDSVAQYERQIIRGRIKAALRVKRDRNERVGRTMYGFRVGGDGKTLESDEKEQTVIEEARRLRAAGLTFRTVAEVLAAQGMLSRSGRVFDPKQVLRMLVAA
jgi:DNA invertase Pin-like site-specific DNA recombinase